MERIGKLKGLVSGKGWQLKRVCKLKRLVSIKGW